MNILRVRSSFLLRQQSSSQKLFQLSRLEYHDKRSLTGSTAAEFAKNQSQPGGQRRPTGFGGVLAAAGVASVCGLAYALLNTSDQPPEFASVKAPLPKPGPRQPAQPSAVHHEASGPIESPAPAAELVVPAVLDQPTALVADQPQPSDVTPIDEPESAQEPVNQAQITAAVEGMVARLASKAGATA
eukprot:TRINITY_DN4087_c0_g1_i2.p1 TRINITY_DN4087_c0_g1~~TRINITY_DN4087_c0_g1_i2.p1  ORF type:complete len:211 (+),score=34.63 TRINITY_DN4087_c0_g1_i2:76-633(+)